MLGESKFCGYNNYRATCFVERVIAITITQMYTAYGGFQNPTNVIC